MVFIWWNAFPWVQWEKRPGRPYAPISYITLAGTSSKWIGNGSSSVLINALRSEFAVQGSGFRECVNVSHALFGAGKCLPADLRRDTSLHLVRHVHCIPVLN